MPDGPGREERREGSSIPLAAGWTRTEPRRETLGRMSCPDSDAWAVLWSLWEEKNTKERNVNADERTNSSEQ